MSKSLGNVVNPYWDDFKSDSVRLYFLSEGP
jgi:leucyl-tRNA synthetase